MDTETSSSAQTLSVRRAAKILGVGKSTLYDAIARNQIPCIPVGTRKLIPIWWVEATLAPPRQAVVDPWLETGCLIEPEPYRPGEIRRSALPRDCRPIHHP
jgi:excisionase family DNA binding protein